MKWFWKLLCKLDLKHDLVEVPKDFPLEEAPVAMLFEVRMDYLPGHKEVRVYLPTCTRCGNVVAGFELLVRKWTVRRYAG